MRDTVASVTPVVCRCGWSGDLFFQAADNWERPCPDCGVMLNRYARGGAKTYGNRRFTESEGLSMAQGFHPSEVAAARKLMPRSADCIRSDGTVVFPDSHSEKTFRRELDAAKRSIGAPTTREFDAPVPSRQERHANPDHVARMRELGVNVRP